MKRCWAPRFGADARLARSNLALPPGTDSGRTFRLKGKGLKAKSGTGDLLATVRIVLPDHPDDELKELMRKWRDQKPYDPRKDLE